MPGLNEISAKSLMRLIGSPDCPELIDLCIDPDFEEFPYLIPGSRRVPHTALDPADFGSRPVVAICQKGKKLSHGGAALLRSHGVAAEVLEGGIHAWRDADLPKVAASRLPQTHLWVTRHRPKIDRIACPWLIRRFVDPRAKFLFVPSSEVIDVAAKYDATAFDVPGAKFEDQDGQTSFDSMVDFFGLTSPALETLSAIIRAADTGHLGQPAQAPGLHAISVGLSRLHKEDQDQLEAGMTIYDALYRWARDGLDEVHGHGDKGLA